jgi:hypothetical protein
MFTDTTNNNPTCMLQQTEKHQKDESGSSCCSELRRREQRGSFPLQQHEQSTSSQRHRDGFVASSGAKRVRFSKQVLCCCIKYHQEVDKIWFSPQELENIRTTCYFTIESMLQAEEQNQPQNNKNNDVPASPIDDEKLCSRGLEQKTPKEAKLRAENKRMSKRAVLIEQLAQNLHGASDTERLASVYWVTTQNALRSAQARGLSDEREVMTFFLG